MLMGSDTNGKTYNGLGEPLPWEQDHITSTDKMVPTELQSMQYRLREWLAARSRYAPYKTPEDLEFDKKISEAEAIFGVKQ